MTTKTNGCKIYRFKFSQEFSQHLYDFSKINEFVSKQDFKDAWERWIIDNRVLIEMETERLCSMGYEGDVLSKMYLSARFYLRNKSIDRPQPKERKPYCFNNKNIIKMIDVHVENIHNKYSPAEGFNRFYNHLLEGLKDPTNETKDIFVNEIKKMKSQDPTVDGEVVESRFKKLYKNRYFLYNKNQS